MTERPQDNLADDAIKTLLQLGPGQGLPRIAEMLLNAAMCFERSNHLNADPYERAQARTGHANGFKPRSLQTAIGELNLALPQVRGCAEPFRTSLLESGSRTDRSLKAAIAEMSSSRRLHSPRLQSPRRTLRLGYHLHSSLPPYC